MGKSTNRSLKLGLLVFTGLILFSVAIYFLGSQQNLFSSSVILKSHFNDVKGLVEGNKVQYSGITVGYVSNIEIVQDTVVLVEISVKKDVTRFIRKDSKVSISSKGLMGSKILNIYPGTADAEPVSANEFLKTRESIEMEDVLKEAQSVMAESGKITANLMEITKKMNAGNGDFSVLLNENNITSAINKASRDLEKLTTETREVMLKINNGEGDLGRLINDTVITTDLNRVILNLENVTAKSDSVADELHDYTNELNNGNGIAYRIVYDTAMANNIDTTIIRVNNGIDEVMNLAETLDDSWVLNLFSGKNKK